MRVSKKEPAEEAAFRNLYETYKNRLYGYILAIVHSPEAAEDLTQELFIKIWENRSRLREVKSPEHYLFVTARNRTLNYIRKAAYDAGRLRELQDAMTGASNNVEDHLYAGEYRRMVEEALQQLSPQRSLVFRLSRFQHLRLEEIAARLSLSRNTVKNHLVEALRFIRTYLVENGVILLLCLSLLVA